MKTLRELVRQDTPALEHARTAEHDVSVMYQQGQYICCHECPEWSVDTYTFQALTTRGLQDPALYMKGASA